MFEMDDLGFLTTLKLLVAGTSYLVKAKTFEGFIIRIRE